MVVEEIGRETTPERAGLKPGDVLLAWERLPNPPANPESARGEFESVFDWLEFEVEQVPRGIVRLIGERNHQAMVFKVGPGEWEITVRARLPTRLEETYREGKQLIDSERITEGLERWHSLAEAADEDSAPQNLRCWLRLHIAEAQIEARAWEDAHRSTAAALELASDAWERSILWQTDGRIAEAAFKLDNALESYRKAEELLQSHGTETLAIANIYHRSARIHMRRDDLTAGLRDNQRALEIRQKLAPGSFGLTMTLNNLGATLTRTEELDLAETYVRQAVRINRDIAPTSLVLASSLNNLAIISTWRGDLAEAGSYFEQALKLHQTRDPQSLWVAGTLNNLGIVAQDRGQLGRAARYFYQSLVIKRAKAPRSLHVASSLSGLGTIATRRGDFNLATEYFQEALEIEQELSPQSLNVAVSFEHLGNIALERGELAPARHYVRQALDIKQHVAPNSLEVMESLANLGLIEYKLGELPLASKYLTRSLEIQQKLASESTAGALVLSTLSQIRREQGEQNQALELSSKALEILEAQSSRLGGSYAAQESFRSQRIDDYRRHIDLELSLGLRESAFLTLERSRAQSFLTRLAERDLVFGDVPEDLDQQRRRNAYLYDEAQHQLAQLDSNQQASEVEELLGELERLSWQRDDLNNKILQASPRLASLRYPEPLDFEAARHALDPGTTLIAYSVDDHRTHLFVLRRGQPLEVLTQEVGKADLRRDVEAILQLQKPGTSPYRDPLHRAGERLYRALIQPAESHIEASERLLLSPDGPLHLLPFALLPRQTSDERGFQYLVEWKPLHAVLSATVYAELEAQRRDPASRDEGHLKLAAFGDPKYKTRAASSPKAGVQEEASGANVKADARGFDFRPLPYSRQEVQRIASLYPAEAARTYLGADATEEWARSVGGRARILHFATHGRYDDRMPLNSFLALSTPGTWNDERGNGLLQTWEIFENLRLDADLVVLSACESGLGSELDGEGLIGLTRAFQFAGARTVIATLWQVSDQASAELMVRFYRHLEAGLSKDEALRAAQLELIRAPVELLHHEGRTVRRDLSLPYFWAGYQMIGDWR